MLHGKRVVIVIHHKRRHFQACNIIRHGGLPLGVARKAQIQGVQIEAVGKNIGTNQSGTRCSRPMCNRRSVKNDGFWIAIRFPLPQFRIRSDTNPQIFHTSMGGKEDGNIPCFTRPKRDAHQLLVSVGRSVRWEKRRLEVTFVVPVYIRIKACRGK